MIAILVCPGLNPELHGLDEHLPTPMLPLGDRPFLQHVVEFLAFQGVRQFEFVLSHLPEKIEDYFGDGQRWGCKFRFHLCSDPLRPYKVVRNIAAGVEGSFLLGHGERLPSLDFKKAAEACPIAIFAREAWTGWGCFAARDLDAGLAEAAIEFPDHILSMVRDGRVRRADVTECLRIDTTARLLESQRTLLSERVPGLMLGGNKNENGVWISRNVSLHPTARLERPVFIGANSKIAANTRIGPFAVIGENCIVDEQSTVVRSLVTPGTYIGEGLELEDVIVDRNRLVNTRIGASCLISETFLVGSLAEHNLGSTVSGFFVSMTAWLFLAVLWPVLLLTMIWLALRRHGKLTHVDFVALPAGEDPKSWKTQRLPCFRAGSPIGTGGGRWRSLLCDFNPGLWAVALGRLRLVGVSPRTRQEMLAMPPDWRSSYRTSKAGLITEAGLAFGGTGTAEETYSAEAFYSATTSLKHDFKLFCLYIWRLFFDTSRQAVTPESIADSGI